MFPAVASLTLMSPGAVTDGVSVTLYFFTDGVTLYFS